MRLSDMSHEQFIELLDEYSKPRRIFLTYDELANYLQTSRSKLEKLKSDGRIPYCQIDGMVRFNKNQIDLWLASSGTKLNFSKKYKAKLEVLQ